MDSDSCKNVGPVAKEIHSSLKRKYISDEKLKKLEIMILRPRMIGCWFAMKLIAKQLLGYFIKQVN